ncbi:MAG: hypothetical protein WAO91_04000 [Candidatus Nitrosotenuis sp.]
MLSKRIEQSLFDEKFRETCVKILDSARHEIYIIAGELGSLKFYDMREATEHAARRGVKVHVYATNRTPDTFRNYCVSRGYELFIGTVGLPTHYLLVDRENMVISMNKKPNEATKVGERVGEERHGDKQKGEEILKIFKERINDKNTIKITDFDKMKDPFYQAIAL